MECDEEELKEIENAVEKLKEVRLKFAQNNIIHLQKEGEEDFCVSVDELDEEILQQIKGIQGITFESASNTARDIDNKKNFYSPAKIKEREKPRILSLDGGGVRGIVIATILHRLEEYLGKSIYESFDLICGTSTGGILAILICVLKLSTKEIIDFYLNMSNEIFKKESNVALAIWKYIRTFCKYNVSDLREKVMKECDLRGIRDGLSYNNDDQSAPLCFAVSSKYSKAEGTNIDEGPFEIFLFRNYESPSKYQGTSRARIVDAIHGTSAAPTYFSPLFYNDDQIVDGGLTANNPSLVALGEAKSLWPNSSPIVVSIGCGCTRKVVSASIFGTQSVRFASQLMKALLANIANARIHSTMAENILGDDFIRVNPNFTVNDVELGDIGLDDASLVPSMHTLTIEWLDETSNYFRSIADRLNLSSNQQ